MKISLIYPSFGVVSVINQANIKPVADNYGVYPNMSLAYVAGVLQTSGHKLIFLDAMASNYSLNDMIRKLKLFRPQIMMFSLTTYLFHDTIEIIKRIKEACPAMVIVGGQHVGLFPKETLKYKVIDIGIIGEAEETIVELLNALDKNKSLASIKSICYRENGKVIVTRKRNKIKDLDKNQIPARNLLPMNK